MLYIENDLVRLWIPAEHPRHWCCASLASLTPLAIIIHKLLTTTQIGLATTLVKTMVSLPHNSLFILHIEFRKFLITEGQIFVWLSKNAFSDNFCTKCMAWGVARLWHHQLTNMHIFTAMLAEVLQNFKFTIFYFCLILIKCLLFRLYWFTLFIDTKLKTCLEFSFKTIQIHLSNITTMEISFLISARSWHGDHRTSNPDNSGKNWLEPDITG